MKKAYVVGIAGGSASGKTTFSAKLAEALRGMAVLELHMDSYFKPAEERRVAEAPITGAPYRDDNHPSSFYMEKLRDDLKKAVDSGEHQVILIEGLLTLQDAAINEMLDLRLFVECQADERIVRRLKRNMQWGLSFDEIAGVYLDMVRYRHGEYVEPSKWRADLILNGSNPSAAALSMIASHVRANISEG